MESRLPRQPHAKPSVDGIAGGFFMGRNLSIIVYILLFSIDKMSNDKI